MNKQIKTCDMKRLLITKNAVLFLLALLLTSCATYKSCATDELVLKCDSTMYAKILNDSIAGIVLKSNSVTCSLQSLNPIDTVRTDSIRTLPSDLSTIVKYLFFEPTNFKSNDIVYGNFSPSACYLFRTRDAQVVYWELDFGLKKWKLLDGDKKEICVSDMKTSNLFLLRLTRIIFPTDKTLDLLYNN